MADESGNNLPFSNTTEEQDEISILDLLLILAARKNLIISLIVLGGLLAAVIAFIMPPTYTATATILPPQQQSSTAAALLGQLGGMASLAGQSLGIKNSADVYVGILKSRTIADEVIHQFGLRNIYQKKTMMETRKMLDDRTDINASKTSSLIEISVKDRNPKRAADLANAYIDRLQEQNSRLAITEASQRRLFFERQLEEEKNRLAEAETTFKKFQEQKGVYQVNSQVEAVIRSLAQMRAEIAAREVNLQRIKAGATTQNPEVLRQEIELKELRNQLQQLERKNAGRNQGDPLMPTAMVPEAGLEYARKLREVKYRESLFELMAKQYEAARIDEAKESPVIQVVDVAVPPEKKSAPRRSVYVLIGIVLGGISGVFIAFLHHAVENAPQPEKVTALRALLWISSKK